MNPSPLLFLFLYCDGGTEETGLIKEKGKVFWLKAVEEVDIFERSILLKEREFF